MKKVYIVVGLEKDNHKEHWRLGENNVPVSLRVYTTFQRAAACVSKNADVLKSCGWREHVFRQIENVREWHDFSFKEKRIALLIIEKGLIV